ncbi:MAG: hypothetical protein ACKOTB_06805 [Planctomycetia bacterium]
MHASEANARGATAGRTALRLSSGGATLEFTWVGDRWAHRVFPSSAGPSVGPSAPATDWRSIEGELDPADDPRWPASPVLVELSRVALTPVDAASQPPRAAGERPSALVGVGLAGRSHYSASIAADPGRTDAFRVEIACRLQEPPPWLGSTYRCGSRLIRLTVVDAARSLPATVLWSYSIGPAGIVAVRGVTVSETGEAPPPATPGPAPGP